MEPKTRHWSGAPPAHLLLAFALSLLVLCGLIAWLQNVHIITANGMYKSIQAEPWIADPSRARLDPSNYLYFPLYGALCRLLDWLGIDRGVPWRQFAWLNAFFASLATVIVYAFVHRLTGSVRAAALAAAFHLGCGFVLLLSVISEDIMPGYTLVLGAMALAGLWFDRPTHLRVALVGALFTVGWLMEWRLLFPVLPALIVALALSPERLLRRAALIGTLRRFDRRRRPGIVQLWSERYPGAVGLHDILWTGKGVATGWAGLSWDKAWMMLSGVGNYFLIVGGWVDPLSAKRTAAPLIASVAIQAAILIAAVAALWPRRAEPRLRAIAIVFLGTLGAGQVLNLYAQPQDPQMQLNVMPWLDGGVGAAAGRVAAALARRRHRAGGRIAAAAGLERRPARALPRRRRGGAQGRGGAGAALPAGLDGLRLLGLRAHHHVAVRAVEPHLGLGRQARRDAKFKWIAIDAGAIRHPDWTAEHNAEVLKRDIDHALDRGYRVVVSDVWTWNEAELTGQLGALSAANRAPAIYRMLHDSYRARPVFTEPTAGTFYELRRR